MENLLFWGLLLVDVGILALLYLMMHFKKKAARINALMHTWEKIYEDWKDFLDEYREKKEEDGVIGETLIEFFIEKMPEIYDRALQSNLDYGQAELIVERILFYVKRDLEDRPLEVLTAIFIMLFLTIDYVMSRCQKLEEGLL